MKYVGLLLLLPGACLLILAAVVLAALSVFGDDDIEDEPWHK